MAKKNQKREDFSARVNDEIKYAEARVIYVERNSSDGANDFNKIMKVSDAKKFADSVNLDIIEINATSNPPILKIDDYKRHVWEMKQTLKKKTVVDTKEIQLSVNISKHDMETKAKHALSFIEKGKKVRIVLIMRGRELGRRDESSKSFYEFLSLMGDNIAYDSAPKDEGNKLITIIRKKK